MIVLKTFAFAFAIAVDGFSHLASLLLLEDDLTLGKAEALHNMICESSPALQSNWSIKVKS